MRVAYRGRQVALQLSSPTASLLQLSEAVQREFQVAESAQKLLVGGKLLRPLQSPDLAVSEAGARFHPLCYSCLSVFAQARATKSLASLHKRGAAAAGTPATYRLYAHFHVTTGVRPGIKAGDKILVLSQPGEDELAILDVPDQRIRGFDEELTYASRRRQSRISSSPPSGENRLCCPLTLTPGTFRLAPWVLC